MNNFNQTQTQLRSGFKELIQDMYKEYCPCAYQRFRTYIQWDQPVCFLDQEVLFSVFKEHLQKIDDTSYMCKCGTIYLEDWEQYNMYLWVLNVTIKKNGNYLEKGAKIKPVTPVFLGFQGFAGSFDELKKTYIQTDTATVLEYLKK